MAEKFVLGLPSKGRMMDLASEALRTVGLAVEKDGDERGYTGTIPTLPEVEVAFVSASEIATQLRRGALHMGITGEDLLRETMPDADTKLDFIAKLGFGAADVVVAIPECWIDVTAMADLEDVAEVFRKTHGRRMRVATKYTGLTRRFFAERGVTSYRIVESLGATEGAPAAGVAELIIDITSTGSTLRANALRILKDGVILRSEANLVAARDAKWTPALNAIRNEIMDKFNA
ncbi:MAG: ATP phosphoribosyltransferase [Pseudomonadota bacterium]